jgi:hypothetical protein
VPRKLTPKDARQMAAARKQHRGGRPASRIPCGWCRKVLGAADLRAHLPHCPRRPQAT